MKPKFCLCYTIIWCFIMSGCDDLTSECKYPYKYKVPMLTDGAHIVIPYKNGIRLTRIDNDSDYDFVLPNSLPIGVRSLWIYDESIFLFTAIPDFGPLLNLYQFSLTDGCASAVFSNDRLHFASDVDEQNGYAYSVYRTESEGLNSLGIEQKSFANGRSTHWSISYEGGIPYSLAVVENIAAISVRGQSENDWSLILFDMNTSRVIHVSKTGLGYISDVVVMNDIVYWLDRISGIVNSYDIVNLSENQVADLGPPSDDVASHGMFLTKENQLSLIYSSDTNTYIYNISNNSELYNINIKLIGSFHTIYSFPSASNNIILRSSPVNDQHKDLNKFYIYNTDLDVIVDTVDTYLPLEVSGFYAGDLNFM